MSRARDGRGKDSQVSPGRAGGTLRRVLVRVALILSLCVLGVVAWRALADAMRSWMDESHSLAGWTWQLFGARWGEDRSLRIDSATVEGEPLRMELQGIQVVWGVREGVFLSPAGVDVSIRRVDAALLATTPAAKDSVARPRFDLGDLPLRATLSIDSLYVRKAEGSEADLLAGIHGLKAAIEGPRTISLSVRRVESPLVAAQAAAVVRADWTDSDTLLVRLGTDIGSGCCAQDTLAGEAALLKSDLGMGRLKLSVRVDGSRAWQEALPALRKAPALRQISLELDAARTDSAVVGTMQLGLSSDSILFIPPLDVSVSVHADGKAAEASLRAWRRQGAGDSANLEVDLSTAFAKGGPAASRAKGWATIRGLGMPLRKFDHPFDGRIEIRSLDRVGANVNYKTRAGSVFDAKATWKPMHWSLVADVVPDEPWAVAWVDSLHMDGRGTIHGRDSAGGALFHVLARHPRIRPLRLDSLQTRLWIGPGPLLVFKNMQADAGEHRWFGAGRIAIKDSTIHFELAPAEDSTAFAKLDARFGGNLVIVGRNFPSDGLPLDLPVSPTFPVRADADLVFSPTQDHKLNASIRAALRGSPSGDPGAGDSLLAGVDLFMTDSVLLVPRLSVRLGSSSMEGKLALSKSLGSWILDTLEISTPGLDLSRLASLSPRIPVLTGALDGHVGSIRGQGVSANLRAIRPGIHQAAGVVQLPDLFLWGERDTLHLGGWLPVPGGRAPFRLTATDLWEPTLKLDLVAFWGDVLRLKAGGTFRNKRSLQIGWVLDGNAQVPGTEVRMKDISVRGDFTGESGPKGFQWKAHAHGERGTLQPLAGVPLDLRFDVLADPQRIVVSRATLSGVQNGTLEAKASLDLASKAYSVDAHARDLKLDLSADRAIRIGSLDISKTDNSRLVFLAQSASYRQKFPEGQVMEIHLAKADLSFDQAKDWRKLAGRIDVDHALFTRDFASPKSLWAASMDAVRGKRKAEAAGSTVPLILDLRLNSIGDSILVRNNLGAGRLKFDLGVSGPSTAPILNGFFAADSEGGRFGYLGRNFNIDTLRVDWDNADVHQGKFSLAGFRTIRRSCAEASDGSSAFLDETCQLRLSAAGNLEDPRLRRLVSDCAPARSGDDGTVGAAVALATGCYPQQQDKTLTMGAVVKGQAQTVLGESGKNFVNDMLQKQLERSRDDARWLPDSILLTEVPTGTTRDQLGLMALYHITSDLDFAGTYQHTFGQATPLSKAKPQLYDNYGVSVRYNFPFSWIEDPAVRDRLVRRVFLQTDWGQSLDDNSRRQSTIQPSLRYRWEFW